MTAPPAYHLGREIRRLRRELGLTQEQAAMRAGLSRDVLQSMESADRNLNAHLGKLDRLAPALGVTIFALIEGAKR